MFLKFLNKFLQDEAHILQTSGGPRHDVHLGGENEISNVPMLERQEKLNNSYIGALEKKG